MEFRLLGPDAVLSDGRPVPVPAAKHRALLALLLLRSDRVVSTDDLIDGLWGENPPKTARTTIHNYVRRLRQALGQGDPDLLGTEHGGYVLRLAPHRLDVREFECLVAEAAEAEADVRPEEASVLLRRSLGLWRGKALEGTASAYLAEVEAPRLEEARISAFERLVDIDLGLGRHAELLGELRSELSRNPLRERLRAQYMLALYRADRRADALEVYREGRRILVEELGIEPGPLLKEMERGVLSDSSELRLRPGPAGPARLPDPDEASRGTVPMQLPADVHGFVGRRAHVCALDAYAEDTGSGGPVVITAIDGQGGVGKTALAVHWAHSARERFPDGQLYIDLRGHSASEAVTSLQALSGFLYALGVPGERIPTDLDRAVGLYRTLLAGRRMLVVLDNAESPDQVRPLLPGESASFVVVTSRDMLAGLIVRDNARHLKLDVLPPAESGLLLERVLGSAPVAAEPQAAEELAELCEHLPLALRVSAVHILTAGGRTPVADYVERLRDRELRLGALSVPGDEASSLHTVLTMSYESLSPDERMLFRRLSLVPGPVVTAGAAAAVFGASAARTSRSLKRLVAAHLVAPAEPGVYLLHDLVRIYAVRCTAREEGAVQRAACLRRLYDYYADGVDGSARLLHPEKIRAFRSPEEVRGRQVLPADQEAARAWLSQEHAGLVAAVQSAGELGLASMAWVLCDGLRGHFWLVRTVQDWISVSRAAVEAAESAGHVLGLASARVSLGDAYRSTGQYEEAARHYRAVVADPQLGHWGEWRAQTLNCLGLVDILTGRLRDAVDRYTEALACLPDDPEWTMLRLSISGNTALLHHELGDLRLSESYGTEALELSRRIGSRSAEGVAQGNRGQTLALLGRADAALDCLTDALAIHREVGNRGSEAETLRALAEWQCDTGEYGTALDFAEASAALADEIGERRLQAAALQTLGSVQSCLGRLREAGESYGRALELAERVGAGHTGTLVLIGKAEVLLLAADPAGAALHGERAAEQARLGGYRILEGRALTLLARVALAGGKPEEAVRHATEAAAALAGTGYRLGVERAREVLESARLTDPPASPAGV